MKGIILNLLEEVVTDRFGGDAWDDMLERAGVDGVYTSLGSYPDAEMFALVAAAATLLDAPPDDVVRLFGELSMPKLADRFPNFFSGHASTRPFLLTLNNIIHAEVRKLYQGADVPDFDFGRSDDEVLRIGYTSGRQLCAMAEGFVIGAARIFGEDVALTQPECTKRGDETCIIECRFSPAAV